MAHKQNSAMLLFTLLKILMCVRAGCLTCRTGTLDPEKPKMFHIELVKQNILSKLHLKEKPNITNPVSGAALEVALKKLYNSQEEQWQISRKKEKEYEMLSFAKPGLSTLSRRRLHFDFRQEQERSTEMLKATLYIFCPVIGQLNQRVTVKLLLQNPNNSNMTLGETDLELKEGRWSMLEIGPAIQTCFSQGCHELIVDLEVESQEEPHVLLRNTDSHQPFIVAKGQILDVHHQHRRDLLCNDISMCCRRSFYVDFQKIGWHDWIIAPPGYYHYYCTGTCVKAVNGIPVSPAAAFSNFHDFITHMDTYSPEHSCCVPTEYQHLSLLYFTQDYNIAKAEIPNMVVNTCSCS
uniref:Inhibin beta C chain-like n=1 Tax=Pogona vitticeps TaxID=103695 RepID=A0A6J0SHJ7_9SAUR